MVMYLNLESLERKILQMKIKSLSDILYQMSESTSQGS